MQGVLLDTSFLISLTDSSRPSHETSKSYYRVFIDKRVTMYLSSIVASEFQVKQALEDLPLGNFLILPFNIDHAKPCAELTATHLKRRPDGYDRNAVKDDFKLLSQCQMEGISHFATDDSKCADFIRSIRTAGQWATLPVPIYVGDDFDPAHFNPSGQVTI